MARQPNPQREGTLTFKTHTVTTLAEAREWWTNVQEHHLPVDIEQQLTEDERMRVLIWSSRGGRRKIIYALG